MILGTIIVDAIIYDAQSLKDKRSVLKSVSTRIRQRYNVSITESDHQDVWQRTQWIVVSVGTARTQVEKELQRALTVIDNHPDLEVTTVDWEWL
ncbi:uncharacterized protein YlxP (DUF503 family) [Evansella vedderi]|uniref:Uncharacterized protein YlxP (DUF503 family) n=1 Tax=Evansella vedderi TaxID=38282 RepID=A0ABT9ZR37_9BACI|nr:DUF503 domain-containing protein [Evansella vedderi]MDQ0253669.1 uncharacterized protein YlxP (DUF503 family) [Evansella vedderi]